MTQEWGQLKFFQQIFNHELTAWVSVKLFRSLNEAQRIKQKCEWNIWIVSFVMALYSLIMVAAIAQ